ncbi:hypothetical protein MSPP1_001401 [Malassezia sp. CBS 17886]|nr:hypothetical protein MSPP1_001401 [Malassezia sp. CBS 17886]
MQPHRDLEQGGQKPPGTPKGASPSVRDRVRNMWATVKFLFRFYLNGVKQIWRNRERVRRVHDDVRTADRDYTWEEAKLVRTHASDMRKLPLFLLILVTVEELLPLMVIYTPFLLPSTCILPSQKLKIRRQLEVKRDKAVADLRAGATPDAPGAAQQTPQAALSALPSDALRNVALIFDLSTWGGSWLQRRRLAKHLDYLRTDDARLAVSPVMLQPADEHVELVADACAARGIRTVERPLRHMSESLAQWLSVARGEPTPSEVVIALLPMRMATVGDAEDTLAAEAAMQTRQSIVEQTSAVVDEVVEEEKHREEETRREEAKGKRGPQEHGPIDKGTRP